MDFIDRERKIQEILQGFQEIDNIYSKFEKDFLRVLNDTINEYYNGIVVDRDTEVDLKDFARLIFNTTHSVIDKDRSYPNYRLVEELENVRRIQRTGALSGKENNEFSQKLADRLKQLCIEYFNDIYELSGNGFRLMELIINHNVFGFADRLVRPDARGL